MTLTRKLHRHAALLTAVIGTVIGQPTAAQTEPTGRAPQLALPDLPQLPDRAGPERRVPVADAALEPLRAELDRPARGVSRLLAEDATRAGLREAMAATDATADILHLHEWLTTLTDGAGKSGDGAGATELLALTEDAEDRLARLGVGARPYLDLYIPSPELRAAWEGGPLLVAADPLRPEAEVDALTAYRLDGERVEISATEAPELPLLVIAPDEHDTHRPPQVDIAELGAAKGTPDETDTEGAQVLSYHGGSGSIGVPYLRIADDREAKFWKGAPEIDIIIETEPWRPGARLGNATDDLIVLGAHEEIDTLSKFFARHAFNKDGNLTFDELIRLGDHDISQYSNNAAACSGFLLDPYNGNRTCLYVPEQKIGFFVIERDPARWQVLIATEVNPGALPLWGYTEEQTQYIEIDTDVDRRHP